MFNCAHCGNELPDGATFCNQCWKTVDAAPAAPAAPDPTTVASAPPEAPTFAPPLGAPPASFDPAAPAFPSAPPPPPPSPWAGPVDVPPPDPTAWGASPAPDAPDTGAAGWAAPPAPAPGWGPPAAPPPPVSGGWAPPPPPPGGSPYGMGGYAPSPVLMPGYYGASAQRTDGLAIASLVLSILGPFTCGTTSVVGVILGHVSLSRIKRQGTDGRGLAIAGLVIGYLMIAAMIGFILLVAMSDSSTTY